MMRPVVAICAGLALAANAPVPAAHAGRAPLGANFNEHYEDVDFGELAQADAGWIRGFVTMTQLDPAKPTAHIAIATTLTAHDHGLKTILTLKWPYKTPFPIEGTPDFARELAKVDAILGVMLGKADIIEIGNEPFIETDKAYRDQRLTAFYEAVTKHIIAYRDAHCGAACGTRLYMGALNNLEKPASRTPTVARWLAFAKATPQIDGVDIHPHVPALADTRPFLDYVLPRLRPDQHFIATEISLVHHWKAHLKDRVPAGYAARYMVSPDSQVWQQIAAATTQPFTQTRWNDLLTESPWYASQANYLTDVMAMMNATGRLTVATYGFKQDKAMVRHFTADSTPWLLNSVVAGYTVKPAPGMLPTNPYWLAEFKALAKP